MEEKPPREQMGPRERWAKAKRGKGDAATDNEQQRAPIAGEPCRCAVTNHRRDHNNCCRNL